MLTELRQIDAVFKGLDSGLAAHAPEYGEDEGDDHQECECQEPEELQDVGDGHELQWKEMLYLKNRKCI